VRVKSIISRPRSSGSPCSAMRCQRSNIAAVAAVTIDTKGMSRLGWKTGRSNWRCRRHPSPSMVVRLSPKSGLTRAAVGFLPYAR
jgi:hypothetical protein